MYEMILIIVVLGLDTGSKAFQFLMKESFDASNDEEIILCLKLPNELDSIQLQQPVVLETLGTAFDIRALEDGKQHLSKPWKNIQFFFFS